MKNSTILILVFFFIKYTSFGQELPRSAFFGALVSNLNDSIVKTLRLPGSEGTIILRIVDGSSAQLAKLNINDVLVSIGEQNIENTSHFLNLLKKYNGGDKVKVGFYRNAKYKTTFMHLQPKPKETSNEYDIIYSSVISGNNHLRTIITKPKGNNIYPSVLLIGGVGCYSIDNNSNPDILSIKMWVDSLTRNGFVTMRVEKPGMGDSKGIACNECDFITEKQGYLDGLKQLKELPFVNKENIFIAGFSMGGVIAPLIAQQEPIKGIIVYGTVGRNWLEYELENAHRQKLLEDYPPDSLDIWMRAEYKRLYGLYVEKKLPEQIMTEHPETKPTFFNYPMSIKYFQQVADIDIRKLWMNTNAYVLTMHGTSDFVSSSDEHKLIADIVNHSNPKKATYIEIINSDHWGLLAESEKISQSNIRRGLNTLNVKTAIKWLTENLNS